MKRTRQFSFFNSVCFLFLLGSGAARGAEDVVSELSWAQLKDHGVLQGGEVLSANDGTGGQILKVESSAGHAPEFPIVNFTPAGLTKRYYILRGEVRCDDVRGNAHLILLSFLPNFANTISRRYLQGTADWHAFELPGGGGPSPLSLQLSVVLPGRGTIYLRSVRLVQETERPAAAEGEAPAWSGRHYVGEPGEWCSPRAAGLAGAGLGVGLLACLGLIGMLLVRRRVRAFTLGLIRALAVAGCGLLVASVVAAATAQAFLLCYMLMLNGVLWVVLPLAILRPVRRRYDANP